VPERAREHHVGISRIDHDAPDAAGHLETGVRPCLAGVGRLVDTVTDRDVAANERFTSAGPDDIRIGRGDETGWSSKIASQCAPLSVVLKMPPDAAPAK
jgi:hypothetical protein